MIRTVDLKVREDFTLEEAEFSAITHKLRNNKFNLTVTAKKLGISLRSLNNKVNKYRKDGYQIPTYNYFQDIHGIKDFSSIADK